MKAQLNFEFDLPEESTQLDEITHAGNAHISLYDMDQWLRSQIKHGDYPEESITAFELCREELHEIVNHHNVTIY